MPKESFDDARLAADVVHATLLSCGSSHQVSAHIATLANAMKIIHVEPREQYYLILDYEHQSAFHMLASEDPTHGVSLTLEEQNVPPRQENKFKNDFISPDVVATLNVVAVPRKTSPVTGAVPDLTSEELEEAVALGSHDATPKSVGLFLDDMQTAFGFHISSGTGQSGFSIVIYSGKQWVEYQAALAHRELRPFGVADVAPEMKRSYVRVLALPNIPDSLTGRNMSLASEVQRIVISDNEGRLVQPIDSVLVPVTLNSALPSATYNGLVAAFPPPDLHKTFQVIVIGEGDVKRVFQVKDKHLARFR